MATQAPNTQTQQRQREPKSTTQWAVSTLAGNYSNMDELAGKLREAALHCRLIGGATCGPLPIGHEAQIIVIPIVEADCYPLKGRDGDPPRLGIGKSIITTIANAAGVIWDSISRRDDGSDPLYALIEVKGRYRQNDGTWRPMVDMRDLDLREGSAQAKSVATPGMLANKRENLLRLAITMAKLRAIRDALGIAHGVLKSDIDRPFVVVKQIFTGRDSDPVIRRMFAAAIGQRFLAAGGALFGAAHQLGAPAPMPALGDGIDLSSIPDYDGEIVDGDGVVTTPEPRRAPPVSAAPPPKPASAPSQAQPRSNGNGGRSGGFTVPGGKEKGASLEEASDETLRWWANKIASNLESGDSRRPDYDREWLAAAHSELDARAADEAGPSQPSGDPDDTNL
jgi:hypothetical protein